MININLIEKIIKYKFKNEELLVRAFTHSSFSKLNNERLEFLGDSVLQVIVSKYLFENSTYDEGVLSKYRAKIVCENNLYLAIKKLRLQEQLIVGDSYKTMPSKAMCADLCEAIIGAIYIDSGDFAECKKFIFKNVNLQQQKIDDYKSSLQEIVQATGETTSCICYDTKVNDAPHTAINEFISAVIICGKPLGKGEGRTKKQAEQNAAKVAIHSLQKEDNKNN